MTPIGQEVLIIYAAIIVFALIVKSFRDIDKKGGKGWLIPILIPILILLVNLI